MGIGFRERTLTVSRGMAASPAAVWDVLVDLDAWPKWGPSVQRAELDDDVALGLGSRGRIWTPAGLALPFVITAFDAGRRWQWTVAGVSATRHEVIPTAGGSRLIFGVPVWAPAYLAVCAIALPRIEKLASR